MTAKAIWVIIVIGAIAASLGLVALSDGGPHFAFLHKEDKKQVRVIPIRPTPDPDPLSKETSVPIPTDKIIVHTIPYKRPEAVVAEIPLPPPAVPLPRSRRSHNIIIRHGRNICTVHHGIKVVTGKTWHCEFHHQ
jgi:hypothetical protein